MNKLTRVTMLGCTLALAFNLPTAYATYATKTGENRKFHDVVAKPPATVSKKADFQKQVKRAVVKNTVKRKVTKEVNAIKGNPKVAKAQKKARTIESQVTKKAHSTYKNPQTGEVSSVDKTEQTTNELSVN